jgi:hypothetical protein
MRDRLWWVWGEIRGDTEASDAILGAAILIAWILMLINL